MAKKYIEAEKLKAEIDKRYAEYLAKMKNDNFTYYEGMADALDLFEQFIDSLQQEQPEFPTTDEEIEIFLATHPKVEVPNKYKTPDWLWKKQEQPEVELEKEIEVASKRFPEVSFAKLSRIAKRFYELGLRAGQVYAATTYNPPCYCGGPCTNPMHDCINCPRQLSGRINTTTGTSSAKVEESK